MNNTKSEKRKKITVWSEKKPFINLSYGFDDLKWTKNINNLWQYFFS